MRLVNEVRVRAKTIENSSGIRDSFRSFTSSSYKIAPGSISYSDFVVVQLLYEATRDAGLWNMHWTITNMPPNSDRVWSQWKEARIVSGRTPTASAECDELSALFALLVERTGVRRVGLFWPYPNHTVAVWVLHPANGAEVRVVVPTSQIFLDVNDSFATKKFNAGIRKRSSSTSVATRPTLSNCRSRSSISSCSKSTGTQALRTPRCKRLGICARASF
jgi:hypothetical protein